MAAERSEKGWQERGVATRRLLSRDILLCLLHLFCLNIERVILIRGVLLRFRIASVLLSRR